MHVYHKHFLNWFCLGNKVGEVKTFRLTLAVIERRLNAAAGCVVQKSVLLKSGEHSTTRSFLREGGGVRNGIGSRRTRRDDGVLVLVATMSGSVGKLAHSYSREYGRRPAFSLPPGVVCRSTEQTGRKRLEERNHKEKRLWREDKIPRVNSENPTLDSDHWYDRLLPA